MNACARWTALLLTAGLACSVLAEEPPESCDSIVLCRNPLYPVVVPPKEGDDCDKSCILPNSAVEAQLSCYYDHGHVYCEAWPRTANADNPITYRWTGRRNIEGGSPEFTDSPTADFMCEPGVESFGMVLLTVRTPVGLTSSTSMLVECMP